MTFAVHTHAWLASLCLPGPARLGMVLPTVDGVLPVNHQLRQCPTGVSAAKSDQGNSFTLALSSQAILGCVKMQIKTKIKRTHCKPQEWQSHLRVSKCLLYIRRWAKCFQQQLISLSWSFFSLTHMRKLKPQLELETTLKSVLLA